MNASQLKPAGQLARRFGVKALVYGGPGSGKTPLFNTAPNPVLCVVEPGMLSMRGSTIPAWEAYTVAGIEEFVKWAAESSEAKKFDTLGFDSISQVAEIYLLHWQKLKKDGRAAYGAMSESVMAICNMLFFMQNKHIYLIAKQGVFDESGIQRKKPYFPGLDLNVKVPHLYDEILHVGMDVPPGMTMPTKVIRTRERIDILARDRSGKLDELEPPDLNALFNKAMS